MNRAIWNPRDWLLRRFDSSTGERVSPSETDTAEARLMYLRHLFAYQIAMDHLTGAERVLDVGCGTGYGTSHLAERSLVATGVDVDLEVVRKAEQRYASERCHFELYEGTRLPLDSKSVDVITAMQVLEHVPNDRAFLQELHRVLAEGGTAFFTTPNRDHRLLPGQRPWNRYHVREYSPEDFRSILSTAFPEVDVAGVVFSEPARTVELARIARLRKLARLDPLGLRRFLPEGLVHLLGKRGGDPKDELFRVNEAQDLFNLNRQRPSEGLDLLAVVKR